MKKGKIMLAFMLVIALLLGTQAYAQEGDAVPEVSMTMDTSAEDGTVNVGDTLQFTLTAANPGGMTDLGGSFLRFRVSGTEDITTKAVPFAPRYIDAAELREIEYNHETFTLIRNALY